jgi:hypothetical protein
MPTTTGGVALSGYELRNGLVRGRNYYEKELSSMPTHMTSSGLKLWVSVLSALIVFGAVAAVTSEVRAKASKETHCVQVVTPMTPEREALGLDSKDGEAECFDTEAEALAASASIGGGGAGGARYSTMMALSVFKVWTGEDWTGSSYLWTVPSSCSGYFFLNSMPAGWNDVASSAAVYCGRDVDLWEHNNRTGSYHRVYVADRTLGSLDNEGSSWDTAD